MKSIKEQLIEEFDKLTPYPEDCGDDYSEQKEWLKKNNHLYNNEVYNEPMYDLSEDKIKKFLSQAIDRVREETINNINVSFLRQWLNEDRITDENKMVSNEEIMKFIKRFN